jgi:Ion channel
MTEITGRSLIRESLRHRFGVLFVALLVTLAVPPLTSSGPLIRLLFSITITAVLLSGLFAVSAEKKTFYIGLALVIPAVAANWVARLTMDAGLDAIGEALSMLFMFYLAWNILVYIIRARRVDANIIFAAVCVYLLIGFIGAFGFSILELLTEHPLRYPSDLAGGLGSRETITLYYSFVTLTTLGYGDISPVSAAARSLAMLEAVTGQLILVVLIARLIGLTTAQIGAERTDTNAVSRVDATG